MTTSAPAVPLPWFLAAAALLLPLVCDATRFAAESSQATGASSDPDKTPDVGSKTPEFTECESLKHVINCSFQQPMFLAFGGFGQAWVVKDLNGDTMVLKLINNHLDKFKRVLYYADFDSDTMDDEIRNNILEAMSECKTEQELAKGSDNVTYVGRGKQRIVRCFDHNLDTKPSNEPVYMLMEYGGITLWEFESEGIESGTWSLPLVRQIAKQLLEGIEYLQSFQSTWIHHDLKPHNIVVDLLPGSSDPAGRVLLKLIDFGSAVHHDEEAKSWCKWTSGSALHMPMEYAFQDLPPEEQAEFGCKCINYYPRSPKALDMYSFGTILFDILVTVTPQNIAQWFNNIKRTDMVDMLKLKHDFELPPLYADMEILMRLAFELPNAEDAVKNMLEFIADRKEAGTQVGPQLCREVLADPVALRFVTNALKTLSVSPRERPLAAELLQDPWMTGIASVDDPNYSQESTTRAPAARLYPIHPEDAAFARHIARMPVREALARRHEEEFLGYGLLVRQRQRMPRTY